MAPTLIAVETPLDWREFSDSQAREAAIATDLLGACTGERSDDEPTF